MTSIHKQIRELLERDEPLSAEQQAHLTTCPDCASYARLLGDLRRKQWDAGTVVDEGLGSAEKRAVIQAIKPHVRYDEMFRKSKYGVLAGLAGVLALGLFVFALYFSLMDSSATVASATHTVRAETTVSLGATEPFSGSEPDAIIASEPTTRQAEQEVTDLREDNSLFSYQATQNASSLLEISNLTNRHWTWVGHFSPTGTSYSPQANSSPYIQFSQNVPSMIAFAGCGTATGSIDIQYSHSDETPPIVADAEFINNPMVDCPHAAMERRFLEQLTGQWSFWNTNGWLFILTKEDSFVFHDANYVGEGAISADVAIQLAPLLAEIRYVATDSFTITGMVSDRSEQFRAAYSTLNFFDGSGLLLAVYGDAESAEDAISSDAQWRHENIIAQPTAPVSEAILAIWEALFEKPLND